MMDTTTPSFDFDQYQPRESTPMATSRRGFLQALMSEVHAYSGKVDGKPTLKLADLAALPDDELAEIQPIRINSCKISLYDKMVWAQPFDALAPVVLFPAESAALQVFNLFDGHHTLLEAKSMLLALTSWTDEKSWAYTRGLFLHLVKLKVCVPK